MKSCYKYLTMMSNHLGRIKEKGERFLLWEEIGNYICYLLSLMTDFPESSNKDFFFHPLVTQTFLLVLFQMD